MKARVYDLRNLFYFLFFILGNVEASAAARFLSRFAVGGLLASTKLAVIVDLKQCLKWLINACNVPQFRDLDLGLSIANC